MLNDPFLVEFTKAIRLSEVESKCEMLKVFYDHGKYEIRHLNDNGNYNYTSFPRVYEANCVLYFHVLELDDLPIMLRLAEAFDVKYQILN